MILAHGIGGRSDLPVPLSLVIGAAAFVLVATFAGLSMAWRHPRLQAGPAHRNRGFLSPPTLVLSGVGVLALALVIGQILPPIIGIDRVPLRPTIAPVTVWVLFWLVVPFAGALVGDLYTLVDPWRALSRLAGLGGRERPTLAARLGLWPASVALIAFAWLELVHPTPGDPVTLGTAALVFTGCLLAIFALVGRETGSTVLDPFNAYNRLISSISPLGRNERGEVVWRGWLRALPTLPEWPGLWAFVVVMIGTVTYDGLAGAEWFQTLTAGLGATLLGQTVLLIVVVTLVGVGYLGASALAASAAPEPWRTFAVAQRFAHTLVPIGLAYAISHYFTLVLFEGQQVMAAVSDPFGLGWDLFGTAERRVEFFFSSSTAVWLVQSGFIVTGHLLGVVLAHDRSLHDFGLGAVRSQYAMLVLMIALTSLGLLILSG